MSAQNADRPVRTVSAADGFSFLDDSDVRVLTDAFERVRARSFRFVGGSVRNPLIGLAPSDLDAATLLEPAAASDAIEAAGWRAVPTGVEHGTVTAAKDGRSVEVTTVRADVKTDGRRAEVVFGADWSEDWRRRDFTMNAIYLGPDGALYDPAGGIDDALARRVRFIGDADARIAEDHLRILRFYRFCAWYGAEINPQADAACARGRDGIARLSAERVRAELLRLLAAPNPRSAVAAMLRAGVLAARFDAAPDEQSFNRLVEIAGDAGPARDAIARLAALFPDAGADFADALRFSKKERDALVAVQEAAEALAGLDRLSPNEVRARRYPLTSDAFGAGAALAQARGEAQADDLEWRRAIATGLDWTPPAFPISGEDARRAGVDPGPAIGWVLKAVENDWIEADFPDDPAFLAKRLKARAAETASGPAPGGEA
ncbi:MAG: CCA tRNA nucleotidyltransferase [Pseudomonadota bacterium]